MPKKNKKIILFIAGGTLLLDKDDNLLAVQNKSDIEYWLKQMPELNMLADLETILVSGEDQVLTPQTWEKIAGWIVQKAATADGLVLVVRPEQIIETSAALSFLLQNFNKTIILTGSRLSGTDYLGRKEVIKKIKSKQGGLGLRANLINALQVADRPLPGPAIMFGSRLLPALQALPDGKQEMNIFRTGNDNYWGQVDFGISLKSGLKYSEKNRKIYKKIQAEVLLWEDWPGLPWHLDKKLAEPYQAVLVKLAGDYRLEAAKRKILKSLAKPVVLYHPDLQSQTEDLLSLSGCTWPVLVIKSMWALANQKLVGNFDTVMKQNIVGEFVKD